MNASAAIPFGWARAADKGVHFRRITDADLPFLVVVYASTRTEELAVTPWTDAEKVAFLQMQFQAQHAHYQQYYPEADWLVTMREGEDVGRLYIERWPSQHRCPTGPRPPGRKGTRISRLTHCRPLGVKTSGNSTKLRAYPRTFAVLKATIAN